MPRPRKPQKQTNQLLEALEFVSLIQDEKSHCILKDGWCAATNGVMSMGTKLEDQIDACPQTRRLATALRQAGSTVALALVNSASLSVRSGPLRASVPCVDPSAVPIQWADSNIAPLTESFKDACKAIAHIASESGDKVQNCSLLVQDQTILATNGQVLIEYWHGNSMPPYFVLPKSSVSVLLKINKKLAGFGFTGNSCTFHFEDESWLKTQLFEDKWPNVEAIFGETHFLQTQFETVPPELFKAIRAIKELSNTNSVKFRTGSIASGIGTNTETVFDVVGLTEGPTFHIDNLLDISDIAKSLHIVNNARFAAFYGDNLRGAIVAKNEQTKMAQTRT